MSMPDLEPKFDARKGSNSTMYAEVTGVPDNGNNVIGLPWVDQGIPPSQVEEDWIEFRVEALGPSVTGASVVGGSLSPDKRSITLNFSQSGGDAAILSANLIHTEIS
jgi:hypothetical protein